MTGDGLPGHVAADQERLAATFSQARARLVRIAYAILGTHTEAEDVVADCWLRLVAADEHEPVRDVESWAVVAVSRMALDVLRSARVRRERYVGPWLPEPVLTGSSGAGAAIDPADKVTLDDEVSYALLVVLEALSPPERTAFVLHDLFGLAFGEIATVVGRSPASVRQLASRARRHVRKHTPLPPVDAAGHRRVVEAFEAAASSGDLATLIRLLDPDVVLVSDGGGVVTSARKPVRGGDRVARFVLGVIAKAHDEGRLERVDVNSAPGFAAYYRGDLVGIVSVTVAGERVTRVDIVRAPGKLPRGRPQPPGILGDHVGAQADAQEMRANLAARVNPEHATSAARPWPSAEKPAVYTDRPRGPRPELGQLSAHLSTDGAIEAIAEVVVEVGQDP